jgi:hypothetical protein
VNLYLNKIPKNKTAKKKKKAYMILCDDLVQVTYTTGSKHVLVV